MRDDHASGAVRAGSPNGLASKTGREAPDRWTALLLLAFIYGISSADRLLMSIFIEPIKTEFGLSDTGVGFITGTIFAVFYVGASIPMGMIGDRYNRRNLLAICGAFFSAMTALTGLSYGYTLMLLSRIGVAVGESGFTPVSVALLSDKFRPHRRYAVLTLFSLGVSLGSWAAASGAGYLESRFGWRFAMQLFGLAGLPAALLLFLLVREPVRGATDDDPQSGQLPSAGFLVTLRACITRRSVLHTIIGAVVTSFWGWGMMWWAPAFLGRSFGVSTAEAGAITGWMHAVVGTGSIFVTALILFPIARRDVRAPLWLLAVWAAFSTIPSTIAVLSGSLDTTIIMFWLFMPMSYASTGPILATIGAAMPANMRGQASAICLALCNFAALALSSQLVGVLSDLVAPYLANPAESLRYALIPLSLCSLWGAIHFWMASRCIRSDMAHLTPEARGQGTQT